MQYESRTNGLLQQTSLRTAASIVRGGPSNGLTNWKNSDGVALKDLD
jgi:hypothetical protein